MTAVDAVIVGGGISGLAAAYRLRRLAPGASITLLEASGHLGGKIGTERERRFLIEWGPDSFLSRKPAGITLCRELGLTGELIGRNPALARTFVLRHGRLHPLPEGLTGLIPTNVDALTGSTLLTDAARERLAQEPSLPPRPAGGDESIAAFIARRLGQELLDNLIEPLMGGIYAGQVDQLSLAATFPQLRQLELAHGSLLGGLQARPAGPEPACPPFVSFRNGMATLVQALVAATPDVTFQGNGAVSAVYPSVEGYTVTLASGARLRARAVIVTTPAFVAATLLEGIDTAIAGDLSAIPYASTALVNLAFDEDQVPPLDGYGYVVPRIEGRAALACTWTSRKWPNRSPNGSVLLRLYFGRFGGPDVSAYDDECLLTMARAEVRETLGIDVPPTLHRIMRFPRAMPQYNLGHLDLVARLERRLKALPGLYLAGAAFRGVGIPDCIVSGEAAARGAHNHLAEKPRIHEAA